MKKHVFCWISSRLDWMAWLAWCLYHWSSVQIMPLVTHWNLELLLKVARVAGF